jgi:ribosomal protein L28
MILLKKTKRRHLVNIEEMTTAEIKERAKAIKSLALALEKLSEYLDFPELEVTIENIENLKALLGD